MNVDELVDWGQAILDWLDKQPNELRPTFDPDQVKQKLGWVIHYRTHLAT